MPVCPDLLPRAESQFKAWASLMRTRPVDVISNGMDPASPPPVQSTCQTEVALTG